jgi:NAD(P)-dependent dehydrogenase (short-subunit alcohol dehydrogenase family)
MTVSLVTGAGSGIGAATATALARRGDRVVCVDLDPDRAEAVAAGIEGPLVVAADVTDEDQCDRMVRITLEHFGDLDVVVTCAGIEEGDHALDVEADTFRQVVDVNLTGSFLTAQRAARAMRDRGHGGAIVLIGSINSQMALPRSAAYSASKGGVLMLGRALAVDLAPLGIRVNVIGPGVTDTPMSARTLADPDRREKFMGRTPLGRPADPGEIAEAVLFLTSEASSYVTGAFLPVDGGWLAG